jgi:hypothetical protein
MVALCGTELEGLYYHAMIVLFVAEQLNPTYLSNKEHLQLFGSNCTCCTWNT